jgi:predicted pyridoxine 5'-phosphate oxidase superfamily flavin-nucleotide-binding protein
VFGGEQVRIRLDARLDASSTALVTIPLDVPAGSVVDRIELFQDDVLNPETAERGAIDLRWTRPTDTRVAVVVQRPRAGRFRLEVDARIPGRPAARGPMPSLRVDLSDGSRSLIEWSAEDGLLATLDRAAAGDAGTAPRVGQLELVRGDPSPDYILTPSPTVAPPTEAESAAESAAVAPPDERATVGVGRVELADIRLAVDERGRAWGLACFELVSAERVVRIQLPRSWRLFDAVVDGRSVDCSVPTAPLSDNVWEMRLLDVDRPRSVVALFAGDLFMGDAGRRLLDGEPLALAPPAIVGLPCRQVIWTVQAPADISLRVAAPARIVAADALQAERRAAQQRLEADFQQAIGMSAGWQQDRVRAFLESRRDGAIPAADQAWARALTALAAPFPPPPEPLFIVAADEADATVAGRLTIRAVRQRDPTTRGRAIATLSLLACGGLAWMAARRQWSLRLPTVTGLGPMLALMAGLAWIALLVPTWPGFLLAAGAAAAAIHAGLLPRRTAAEPTAAIDIAEATTIYRPQR